ncbi:polyprenyl diphosphate synthase [Flexivirga sp. B27]
MKSSASTVVEMPRHVGLIMDGNRRWARAAGLARVSEGHRAGADHLEDVLGWLTERGIQHVSVYVLSADNIRKRDADEVAYLFRLIESVVPVQARQWSDWQLHIAGDLALLPESCATALRDAVEVTRNRRSHLTLAIGYDPKEAVRDAVRGLLAEGVDVEDDALVAAISDRLPGGPIKDIDLVVRTSGEHRISGFFPWQSQHAEIVFSDKMWPSFAEKDLDAALAEYTRRRRAAAS